jgi:hypothetical protein
LTSLDAKLLATAIPSATALLGTVPTTTATSNQKVMFAWTLRAIGVMSLIFGIGITKDVRFAITSRKVWGRHIRRIQIVDVEHPLVLRTPLLRCAVVQVGTGDCTLLSLKFSHDVQRTRCVWAMERRQVGISGQ